MNELGLSPKVQAWLDVMPGEAPDRLFDAVMSETADVGQVRPRFGSLAIGLGLRRRRVVVVLAAVALLLLAAAVAFVIGSALLKSGPRVYLDQVVSAPPLSAARAHPVLVTLADGRVLVVGGSDLASVAEVVDSSSGARVTVGEPAGSQALRHTYAGALLRDGRVFLLAPGEAWAFDPGSGSFTQLAGMTAARDDAALVVLQDGRVLISGGYALGDEGNSLSSAEVFDPATGRFAAVSGVMAYGRQHHEMVATPDGGALVFSGLTRIEGGRIGNSQVEVFDPRTGAFQIVLSATPETTVAVALPDGRIALFDGPRPHQTSGNVIMYDVATRTASPTNALPYVVHAALLLDDGRVLVVGAESSGNRTGTFDPVSGSLVDAPMLSSWSPSAVRLADGRVLLVGGFSGPEPADDAAPAPPAVPTVQIFQ